MGRLGGALHLIETNGGGSAFLRAITVIIFMAVIRVRLVLVISGTLDYPPAACYNVGYIYHRAFFHDSEPVLISQLHQDIPIIF